jgi:hypothetical protein
MGKYMGQYVQKTLLSTKWDSSKYISQASNNLQIFITRTQMLKYKMIFGLLH